jgi:O-antigen ligase
MPNMAVIQPGIRDKPPLPAAGLVLAASLFALFFGLASAFLPAWLVVSLLILPALLTLLVVRPEYALLACIALVCGLVHPAFMSRVPVLGGSLTVADATFVMLTAYAAVMFVMHAGKLKSPPVAGARWLAAAFGLFGVSLVIATTLSLMYWNLNPAWVLGEVRRLLYLILLPVAIVILRQRQQQERFVIGLVALGCLFSVGQVLQGVFGLPVFGTAGMSSLETLGYTEHSTIRSNTSGLSVIIFALLLVTGAYVLHLIKWPLFLAVAGLLAFGIFLTFGRTTFAVVAACIALAVWWLELKKLPQLILVSLIAMALGGLVGGILKPEAMAAVIYRMTSISSELEYGYSAGWRYMEFEEMVPHILQYPFTGIGLGADYKGFRGSTDNPDLNRYVHNAYLYMAGKMGVPALVLFLLAMATIFHIGRREAKSDGSPWVRVVGAASAAMMIRFVLASMTEPHLMSDHGIVNIAIAGALVILAGQRMDDTVAGAGRPGLVLPNVVARHSRQ